MLNNAHFLDVKSVLKELGTSLDGLSQNEAVNRQLRYGLNEPARAKKRPTFLMFLDQFKSPLIYLLIISGVIIFFLGKNIDAAIIIGIVVFNAIIGFLQESKAQNAIEALKKIVSLRSKVVREGIEHEISTLELVPGDIVILEPGMKVSADLRLIEAESLKIDESLLTGESLPVYKNSKQIIKNAGLSDRKNMAYSGTLVASGRGLGVIIATAGRTELGQIAKEITQAEDEPTPLIKKVAAFSKTILILVIAVCILVFILGIVQKIGLTQMFLTSVALAVSAIPEGLPAIITIALAIGINKMAQDKALIRKLDSVESLGAVTVIASDKTGTLTLNQMTLERLVLSDGLFNITGEGYHPEGKFLTIKGRPVKKDNPLLNKFFTLALLCNNSQILEENGVWQALGDPTEASLVCAGIKAGINQSSLKDKYPRLDEIPFSEDIAYMATLHAGKKKNIIAVKGTLENLLKRSSWYEASKKTGLNITNRAEITTKSIDLANDSYRILAVAYKEVPTSQKTISDHDIKNLTLVGFGGMKDPVRQDAIAAIQKCQSAGIKVLMLTGDFPQTAGAVARKLGIINTGNGVISGNELQEMNDKELNKIVAQTTVYARLSPKQKLRIVTALQKQGEIVGVTGDGINDAPILKKADIGISMGLGGTDAAREASDMVLLDNNFATIIKAVAEGRTILENIRRAIFFLLSTNLGEVLIITTALILVLPIPLTAIQILWINFVTDTSAAVGIVMEPQHKDVLDRPPRNPEEHLINKMIFIRIFIVAIVMTMVTVVVFALELKNGTPLNQARSTAFALMAILQIFNHFNCRSFKLSILQMPLFSNLWLWGSFVFSLALTVLTIEWPPLQEVFHTARLNIQTWAMILILGFSLIVAVEIEKFVRKIFKIKSSAWRQIL